LFETKQCPFNSVQVKIREVSPEVLSRFVIILRTILTHDSM